MMLLEDPLQWAAARQARDYWKRVTYVYARWLTRYYAFLHRRH